MAQKQKKNEVKVRALGAPWSVMMKSFRVARDAEVASFDKEPEVDASIKRLWKKNRKREYENDLKLMIKLARKQRKLAKKPS